MNGFLVSLLVAAGLGVAPLLPGGTDELTVQALEAVAQIEPHPVGQRQIDTPTLTFSLRVDFGCADDAVASLSVGISDTHYRHVPRAGDAAFLAVIEVPALQIAPITTSGFCADGSAEDETLLLNGVATAQVALRCASDEHTTMHIASSALPLRLVCVAGADQEAPPVSD